MLRKLFAHTVYVQVRRTAFRLLHIEANRERELAATRPFTMTRLLVGQFREAESLLRKGIRELSGGRLFRASPAAVIHPLEMAEDGLSEVEERVLRELALGAGARSVYIHTGAPLSDAGVVSASRKGNGR